MTKFESWLKACKEMGDEVWKLEECGNVKLFKLIRHNRKGNHYENNYHYMDVNYHVWNTDTGEWFVHSDYRTAYEYYKKRRKSE